MTTEELKHLDRLRIRLGTGSRSESVREIVKRFEKMEHDASALNACIKGYLAHPETNAKESKAILRAATKNLSHEDWA